MTSHNKALTKKFNQALFYERRKEYQSALNAYIAILKVDKEFREAYINLGSLYARMNRLDDAMKCYNSALQLGKDYLTYFNLSCVYYKKGDYKKAIINLQKSKDVNRDFILSTLVMGLSFSKLKNIKAAESNFRDVLKIMPHNRVALTALAIIYYNAGKYDASLELLDILLKTSKLSKTILELKSDILFKSGRYDECAADVKVLKKRSHGYQLYDQFIKSVPVEKLTDRYGTIEDKINELEEKSDNQSLISLSLCHLFKGDTDTAIDYLFRARKEHISIN